MAGRQTAVSLIALVVSGCATGSESSTGSIGPRAGYTLTAIEQGWHCDALENALNARITTIASLSLQAKAESEATPSTLSRLVTRMFGEPGQDNSALEQIKPERSAADAYNATLKSKGCVTVDIDAKLAPAQTAVNTQR
jgi:hypothetical protein